MYKIGYSGKFQKDIKLLKKRSFENFEQLRDFIKVLQIKGNKGIHPNHRPHKLSGKYSKHWECHVINDLLLIWKQDDVENTIILIRTGSHADLFK